MLATTDVDTLGQTGAPGLWSARWEALGTGAHLIVTDAAALPIARRSVEAVLAEIDETLSRFRPDSELSRLNAADGAATVVSPLMVRALRIALDAAAWTDGRVDPTVGRSLLDLGYDRTFRSVPADGPAITIRSAPAVGWQYVELDDVACRVRIPRGVLLDLGATAKGLAADLSAAAAFDACGSGVLVNLGGDLSVAGPAPWGGWPVLVTDDHALDPAQPSPGAQTVAIAHGGLASSGTAARRWQRGGSMVHHIIDPRTGAPSAEHWRTASVTAPTCAMANAAATCAIVAGAGAPNWLRDRNLAARLVSTSGEITLVGGWPA